MVFRGGRIPARGICTDFREVFFVRELQLSPDQFRDRSDQESGCYQQVSKGEVAV